MRMLFICFANVARSQVAEHISRCSHNMIAISHGIAVDFWVPKHMLHDVKTRFQADRYVHIGDRDIDRQLAEQVGFHFWWDHEAVAEPWLAWLTDQR